MGKTISTKASDYTVPEGWKTQKCEGRRLPKGRRAEMLGISFTQYDADSRTSVTTMSVYTAILTAQQPPCDPFSIGGNSKNAQGDMACPEAKEGQDINGLILLPTFLLACCLTRNSLMEH
jgi:hypothetical protein